MKFLDYSTIICSFLILFLFIDYCQSSAEEEEDISHLQGKFDQDLNIIFSRMGLLERLVNRK